MSSLSTIAPSRTHHPILDGGHVCFPSCVCALRQVLDKLKITEKGTHVEDLNLSLVEHQSRHLPYPWREVESLKDDDALTFMDYLCVLINWDNSSILDDSRSTWTRSLITLVRESERLPRFLYLERVQSNAVNCVTGGGFADIFRGTWQGKDVALKVPRIGLQSVNSSVKEFCKEVVRWQLLKHPYILSLYGISEGAIPNRLAMVCPWVSEGNISQYLQRYPRVNRIRLLYEIAVAMEYLHTLPLIFVHGDIKPSNIMIKDGHACLSDLGMTQISGAYSGQYSFHGGTMAYNAPELYSEVQDQRRPTPQIDIYAFSITAYEILTGETAFKDISVLQIIVATVQQRRRPQWPANISQLAEKKALRVLIEKCWSHNPMDRPSTSQIVSLIRQEMHLSLVDQNVAMISDQFDWFRLDLWSQTSYEWKMRVDGIPADATLEEICYLFNTPSQNAGIVCIELCQPRSLRQAYIYYQSQEQLLRALHRTFKSTIPILRKLEYASYPLALTRCPSTKDSLPVFGISSSLPEEEDREKQDFFEEPAPPSIVDEEDDLISWDDEPPNYEGWLDSPSASESPSLLHNEVPSLPIKPLHPTPLTSGDDGSDIEEDLLDVRSEVISSSNFGTILRPDSFTPASHSRGEKIFSGGKGALLDNLITGSLNPKPLSGAEISSAPVLRPTVLPLPQTEAVKTVNEQRSEGQPLAMEANNRTTILAENTRPKPGTKEALNLIFFDPNSADTRSEKPVSNVMESESLINVTGSAPKVLPSAYLDKSNVDGKNYGTAGIDLSLTTSPSPVPTYTSARIAIGEVSVGQDRNTKTAVGLEHRPNLSHEKRGWSEPVAAAPTMKVMPSAGRFVPVDDRESDNEEMAEEIEYEHVDEPMSLPPGRMGMVVRAWTPAPSLVSDTSSETPSVGVPGTPSGHANMRPLIRLSDKNEDRIDEEDEWLGERMSYSGIV